MIVVADTPLNYLVLIGEADLVASALGTVLIALAEEVRADQRLMDEAEARREAARRKLPFMGTLGVLRQAARRGLVDLSVTLGLLQATTFKVDPRLIQSLLEEEAARIRGDKL